jgi:hypothetical protein
MKLHIWLFASLVFLCCQESKALEAFRDVIQGVIEKGRCEKQIIIKASFDKVVVFAQANRLKLSDQKLKKLKYLLDKQANLIYDAYFGSKKLFRVAMQCLLVQNSNASKIFSSVARLEHAVKSLDKKDSYYKKLKEQVLNEIFKKYELLDEQVKSLTGFDKHFALNAVEKPEVLNTAGGIVVSIFAAFEYRVAMHHVSEKAARAKERSMLFAARGGQPLRWSLIEFLKGAFRRE